MARKTLLDTRMDITESIVLVNGIRTTGELYSLGGRRISPKTSEVQDILFETRSWNLFTPSDYLVIVESGFEYLVAAYNEEVFSVSHVSRRFRLYPITHTMTVKRSVEIPDPITKGRTSKVVEVESSDPIKISVQYQTEQRGETFANSPLFRVTCPSGYVSQHEMVSISGLGEKQIQRVFSENGVQTVYC